MTDHNATDPNQSAPQADPNAAQAQPDAGAPEAADEAAKLHGIIEALNAESAQLKDKVLRTLAEMENLRRRTEKEVADARAYATTNFARDMLTVADNMRRALENVAGEAREAADGALKAVLEGIELTERDLLKTLERHGIRKIDPKGEKFDPNLHQAMFEVPDPSVPNGTVSQVVQSGFVIGDRVLRPALVGVAKGGPKPTPANGAGVDKEA
ncbi:nucleotide exchange factor GrpE [Alsobacter sp. SYSU M60028]|uniref:Protein GrpE n=1 Tax=Alsobacter ponti TaxID=2962936 RepID=A0ABT1LBC5_9HYPH|nr:nucleotide exchange factor GrpE [Alsobacter ponti]MCP8938060.1 nucleotide exchange factor GrpE [Alsobacter ponti]